MSTIDETDSDISTLTEFINDLPEAIQSAIASGTISLSIKWVEVTRDEDDYPTIKPVVEFKATT